MTGKRVDFFPNKAVSLSGPPACFTPRQWAEWKVFARQVKPSSRSGYCEDCTPEYQAKMTDAGRCGYPGAVFVTDADGMIKGVRRPSYAEEMRALQAKGAA